MLHQQTFFLQREESIKLSPLLNARTPVWQSISAERENEVILAIFIILRELFLIVQPWHRGQTRVDECSAPTEMLTDGAQHIYNNTL